MLGFLAPPAEIRRPARNKEDPAYGFRRPGHPDPAAGRGPRPGARGGVGHGPVGRGVGVMPCLNEADTLATCIRKAKAALKAGGIAGEVVVADNGSTDGSRDIAEANGARVVPVAERGYGNALMGGIAAARG